MNNSILHKIIILICVCFAIIFANIGKNMLFSNQAKSLVMQVKAINFAIDNFTKKYHALPGDVVNTISFGLSPYNSDGNLDNNITDSRDLIEMADGEIVNFWMHLSNSKMLNEKYDGFENEMARTGSTFPMSKIGDYGIVAFSYNAKLYLQIGYSHADSRRLFTKNSSLTPKEAYLYDKKTDDENPFKGKVLVAGQDKLNFLQNSFCTQQQNYDLKNSKPSCQLRIEVK